MDQLTSGRSGLVWSGLSQRFCRPPQVQSPQLLGSPVKFWSHLRRRSFQHHSRPLQVQAVPDSTGGWLVLEAPSMPLEKPDVHVLQSYRCLRCACTLRQGTSTCSCPSVVAGTWIAFAGTPSRYTWNSTPRCSYSLRVPLQARVQPPQWSRPGCQPAPNHSLPSVILRTPPVPVLAMPVLYQRGSVPYCTVLVHSYLCSCCTAMHNTGRYSPHLDPTSLT
jgi:hypothetical protein